MAIGIKSANPFKNISKDMLTTHDLDLGREGRAETWLKISTPASFMLPPTECPLQKRKN